VKCATSVLAYRRVGLTSGRRCSTSDSVSHLTPEKQKQVRSTWVCALWGPQTVHVQRTECTHIQESKGRPLCIFRAEGRRIGLRTPLAIKKIMCKMVKSVGI